MSDVGLDLQTGAKTTPHLTPKKSAILSQELIDNAGTKSLCLAATLRCCSGPASQQAAGPPALPLPFPPCPMELPCLEKMAMSPLVGGTHSSQPLAEASSQALLCRGPLCEAEQPPGALCESFPVISSKKSCHSLEQNLTFLQD